MAGYTLVELLVSLTIFLLIGLLMTQILIKVADIWRFQQDLLYLSRELKNAEQTIINNLEQAKEIKITKEEIIFINQKAQKQKLILADNKIYLDHKNNTLAREINSLELKRLSADKFMLKLKGQFNGVKRRVITAFSRNKQQRLSLDD